VVLPVMQYFFAHEEEILAVGPPSREHRSEKLR
jgi:hypothetical protein